MHYVIERGSVGCLADHQLSVGEGVRRDLQVEGSRACVQKRGDTENVSKRNPLSVNSYRRVTKSDTVTSTSIQSILIEQKHKADVPLRMRPETS